MLSLDDIRSVSKVKKRKQRVSKSLKRIYRVMKSEDERKIL